MIYADCDLCDLWTNFSADLAIRTTNFVETLYQRDRKERLKLENLKRLASLAAANTWFN